MRSSGTIPAAPRAWEPPAVTKLAIGTETKSARKNGRHAGSETSGSDQPRVAQPQPLTTPAAKLGFSFEWAFPLSARWGE